VRTLLELGSTPLMDEADVEKLLPGMGSIETDREGYAVMILLRKHGEQQREEREEREERLVGKGKIKQARIRLTGASARARSSRQGYA